MIRFSGYFLAAMTALALNNSWASQSLSDALPPAGEYQIDSVTTMYLRMPGEVIERIDRTDGATGNTTSTQKSNSIKKPVVTTIPGSGPVRYCQGVRGSTSQAGNCTAQTQSGVDTFSTNINCAQHNTQFDYHKLGGGVWEKRVKIKPQAGYTQKMPAPTQAAMAEVIAKMEERLKVAPPDEAAFIRQQMQMFKQNQVPASPVLETETVETWTFLSAQCSSKK